MTGTSKQYAKSGASWRTLFYWVLGVGLVLILVLVLVLALTSKKKKTTTTPTTISSSATPAAAAPAEDESSLKPPLALESTATPEPTPTPTTPSPAPTPAPVTFAYNELFALHTADGTGAWSFDSATSIVDATSMPLFQFVGGEPGEVLEFGSRVMVRVFGSNLLGPVGAEGDPVVFGGEGCTFIITPPTTTTSSGAAVAILTPTSPFLLVQQHQSASPTAEPMYISAPPSLLPASAGTQSRMVVYTAYASRATAWVFNTSGDQPPNAEAEAEGVEIDDVTGDSEEKEDGAEEEGTDHNPLLSTISNGDRVKLFVPSLGKFVFRGADDALIVGNNSTSSSSSSSSTTTSRSARAIEGEEVEFLVQGINDYEENQQEENCSTDFQIIDASSGRVIRPNVGGALELTVGAPLLMDAFFDVHAQWLFGESFTLLVNGMVVVADAETDDSSVTSLRLASPADPATVPLDFQMFLTAPASSSSGSSLPVPPVVTPPIAEDDSNVQYGNAVRIRLSSGVAAPVFLAMEGAAGTSVWSPRGSDVVVVDANNPSRTGLVSSSDPVHLVERRTGRRLWSHPDGKGGGGVFFFAHLFSEWYINSSLDGGIVSEAFPLSLAAGHATQGPLLADLGERVAGTVMASAAAAGENLLYMDKVRPDQVPGHVVTQLPPAPPAANAVYFGSVVRMRDNETGRWLRTADHGSMQATYWDSDAGSNFHVLRPGSDHEGGSLYFQGSFMLGWVDPEQDGLVRPLRSYTNKVLFEEPGELLTAIDGDALRQVGTDDVFVVASDRGLLADNGAHDVVLSNATAGSNVSLVLVEQNVPPPPAAAAAKMQSSSSTAEDDEYYDYDAAAAAVAALDYGPNVGPLAVTSGSVVHVIGVHPASIAGLSLGFDISSPSKVRWTTTPMRLTVVSNTVGNAIVYDEPFRLFWGSIDSHLAARASPGELLLDDGGSEASGSAFVASGGAVGEILNTTTHTFPLQTMGLTVSGNDEGTAITEQGTYARVRLQVVRGGAPPSDDPNAAPAPAPAPHTFHFGDYVGLKLVDGPNGGRMLWCKLEDDDDDHDGHVDFSSPPSCCPANGAALLLWSKRYSVVQIRDVNGGFGHFAPVHFGEQFRLWFGTADSQQQEGLSRTHQLTCACSTSGGAAAKFTLGSGTSLVAHSIDAPASRDVITSQSVLRIATGECGMVRDDCRRFVPGGRNSPSFDRCRFFYDHGLESGSVAIPDPPITGTAVGHVFAVRDASTGLFVRRMSDASLRSDVLDFGQAQLFQMTTLQNVNGEFANFVWTEPTQNASHILYVDSLPVLEAGGRRTNVHTTDANDLRLGVLPTLQTPPPTFQFTASFQLNNDGRWNYSEHFALLCGVGRAIFTDSDHRLECRSIEQRANNNSPSYFELVFHSDQSNGTSAHLTQDEAMSAQLSRQICPLPKAVLDGDTVTLMQSETGLALSPSFSASSSSSRSSSPPSPPLTWGVVPLQCRIRRISSSSSSSSSKYIEAGHVIQLSVLSKNGGGGGLQYIHASPEDGALRLVDACSPGASASCFQVIDETSVASKRIITEDMSIMLAHETDGTWLTQQRHSSSDVSADSGGPVASMQQVDADPQKVLRLRMHVEAGGTLLYRP